jgi:hypothetical protein
MRSTLVSAANHQIRNRFLLCQMVSEATRNLHRSSAPIHHTINDVLILIGNGKLEHSHKKRHLDPAAVSPEEILDPSADIVMAVPAV